LFSFCFWALAQKIKREREKLFFVLFLLLGFSPKDKKGKGKIVFCSLFTGWQTHPEKKGNG
jgi:hypothetical protein